MQRSPLSQGAPDDRTQIGRLKRLLDVLFGSLGAEAPRWSVKGAPRHEDHPARLRAPDQAEESLERIWVTPVTIPTPSKMTHVIIT
jgi:hypothetical protein